MTITIKDGIGIINGEPVSTDVDYSDQPVSAYSMNTRRMRIDCHNGYKLSVVFGSCTYSDNHDHGFSGAPWHEQVRRAEIAVLGEVEMSEAFQEEWGDSVKGYVTADEILEVLAKVRALPPITPATPEEHRAYRDEQMAKMNTALAAAQSTRSVG